MSKSLIALAGALVVATAGTAIPAHAQQDDPATSTQTSQMPMKGMSGQMGKGSMQGHMMQQGSMMSGDTMQNCQAMQQQMVQLRKEMADLRAEMMRNRKK
ncbi:hypothetical protein [Stakelama marina]|uniref:Uncharacterized protein n=1 Tax=Stakelama marina TaxID=2826939 RepID=A0A8T4IDH7_9SPHN|nr:hypothetical protein [Stakelama marina]MBR0552707.1 hypothetical protein [Stakelama marina]